MERVKMIWDFRGPNAQKIAEHHKIHLDEFIQKEQLKDIVSGTETISEMHHTAIMIVHPTDVVALRTILKPHRGQRYTES
jgi:argonaute-like protein implicated in RNA metabolism and viral defense